MARSFKKVGYTFVRRPRTTRSIREGNATLAEMLESGCPLKHRGRLLCLRAVDESQSTGPALPNRYADLWHSGWEATSRAALKSPKWGVALDIGGKQRKLATDKKKHWAKRRAQRTKKKEVTHDPSS